MQPAEFAVRYEIACLGPA